MDMTIGTFANCDARSLYVMYSTLYYVINISLILTVCELLHCLLFYIGTRLVFKENSMFVLNKTSFLD